MNPNLETVTFYVLAGLLLGFSLLVVGVKNAVHSSLCLVSALFLTAVIFLTLKAPMLAVLQILVYAGAIMVLFLFVIMLLNPQTIEKRSPVWLGLTVGGVGLLALVLVTLLNKPAQEIGPPLAGPGPDFGSPQMLAESLFTDFVLPFEIASIVLLIAIVGAVVLARKEGTQ